MIRALFVFFILGFYGFLPTAQAQPVKVLISISKEKLSHRFSNKMIKQLYKRGVSESDYKITQNADQFTLFQALNDPETQALIWISHGATTRLSRKMKLNLSGTRGMSAQPELVDFRGDNVAPVFKKYSQNIRYVSVIGCNSKEILDYVESDLATNDEIDKFILNKKIIAQFAIRKAAKQIAKFELNRTTTAQPIEMDESAIRITRSIPANAHSENIRPLRVMIGSELIEVLPALAPGQTKSWFIPISNTQIKQVKLESGQNIMTPNENIQFGDLKIILPDLTEMKLFAKTDGTPFGLNFRLFILP